LRPGWLRKRFSPEQDGGFAIPTVKQVVGRTIRLSHLSLSSASALEPIVRGSVSTEMRGLRRYPLPNQEKDDDADDNHQDRADQNQSSWHCRILSARSQEAVSRLPWTPRAAKDRPTDIPGRTDAAPRTAKAGHSIRPGDCSGVLPQRRSAAVLEPIGNNPPWSLAGSHVAPLVRRPWLALRRWLHHWRGALFVR